MEVDYRWNEGGNIYIGLVSVEVELVKENENDYLVMGERRVVWKLEECLVMLDVVVRLYEMFVFFRMGF